MMSALTQPKKFSISILRLFGLMVVGIITMELLARIDDYVAYDAPIASNYNFERMFDFDGTIVHGIPHARYAKWTLNSMGMRGPEPQPAKGQTRVVVYGASEAFGIYETPGHEFPRELEAALNAAQAGNYEVINAGIPGMRIGSGTAYLESLRQRLAPAIVVIYPTPTHYIGVSRPMCGRPKKEVTPPSRMPESRLAQKASDKAKEVLPPAALTTLRRTSTWWEARRYNQLDKVPEASMLALETDIKCAVNAVKSIGAVPVLATHANRFGPVRRDDDAYWLAGWGRQYPELKEGGFIDLEQRANRLIRDVAKAENVALADADLELSGKPENFADHAHFTDLGAKRMGALLASQLRQLRQLR